MEIVRTNSMLNIFKPQILPNFELIELQNVCRICLHSATNMLSLFYNEIDSLVSEFLPQKLYRKPLQPHQICTKCFEQAKTAYVFKKQCEYSDELIKSMLNESIISKTCYEKQTQTDCNILYPCEKCEKKFESSKILRKHRSKEHHNTPNICRTCGKVYTTTALLRHHLISVHPELGFDVLCNHKCHLCEANFAIKFNLKKHLSDVHNINEHFVTTGAKNGASEEECYEFSCGNCLENFEVEDDLKNHECKTFLYEKFLEGNFSNGFQLKNECDKNKIEVVSVSEENECYSVFEENLKTDYEHEKNTVEKNKNEIFISEIKIENGNLFEEKLISRKTVTAVITEPKEKITREVKTNMNPKIPHAKPHLCSECGASFKESQSLRTHINIHTGEKPYKCQYCAKTFAARTNLYRHRRTHTGKKDYYCIHCPKAFSQSNDLKAHIRTHTGERPYKCSYCPMAFTLRANLKQHCRKHTGEHGKRHYCDLCSLSYGTSIVLLNHKRKVHGIDGTKGFSCRYCSEKNIGTIEHKKHLTVCHAAPAKPHMCSECGTSCKTSENLRIHMVRHSGEKPYKCQYCDKAFKEPAYLHHHKKIHTGRKKDHHCTYCHKEFFRSSELKVHMRTHTGERPYKCSYCRKAFAENRSLKKHVVQHTGE